MKDTNVKVKKESNAVLSKFSEEQFQSLRNVLGGGKFDGFYPTLNTELLTLIREDFNWNQKYGRNVDLTEDELISIVKDYGSVSHSVVVNGKIYYYDGDLSEHLDFDISAEKVAEIGVDKIEKWGSGGNLEEVEDNLKSHSMIDEDEYPSSSLEYAVRENSFVPDSDIYVNGVRVITKVKVSLPEPEELFPEKMVA
jgi:hypothetical protein